jgi:3-oxoacyl-[acyl-carrier-protein] synthase II
MSAPRKIVITGVGVVSPIGIGLEPFWNALREGRGGIGPIQRYGSAPLPSRVGAELKDFDAKQFVTPRKSLKVMCPEIQAGFAASVMALEHAGLQRGAVDPDRLGVIFGSEMLYCDPPELADIYAACLEGGEFHYAQFGRNLASKMFPLWMLKYLPNMAACHIGIAQDARGPNNSIVLGEVSSLVALEEAISVLQRGWADVMIVGGTSSRLGLTGMMYRGKCEVSQNDADPENACRPFDRHRDGMVYGEGAGALVVETAQHAAQRGQAVLAEILASSAGFGAPSASGSLQQAAIAHSIELALQRAGLQAADLDYVVAHGLSTRHDDRNEAQAIARSLGSIPVTALKSYFGNLGAATSAVELIGGILALENRLVPHTLAYRTPDPECPVAVICQAPRPAERNTALVLSQSRTGQAAAVVIAR